MFASLDNKATAISVATVAVFASYYIYIRRRPAPHKLHIQYRHPTLGTAFRIIVNLPDFIRRPMLLKVAAPKPPLDGVDLKCDENPFEIKELETDKIWRIRYRFATNPELKDAMRTLFGLDLTDKAMLRYVNDPKVRKHVEAHIDRDIQLQKKNQGLSTREQLRNELEAGCHDMQDMLVTRLSDGESLLIYNPCRMHPPIVEFLNKLGTVRCIVSGSSVHTNQLPQAADVYKSAKIVCAQVAETKCISVGMRKADFVYTLHDDSERGYSALKAELESLGVQAFHVVGDVITQTFVVVAHKHMFEVDLSCYGNGKRQLHCDDKDWENPSPYLSFPQRMYYAAMERSAIPGYLPDYRIMGMDPSSSTIKLNMDEPDSHSCGDMAASLRELLKLDFDYVDNAHSRKQDSLSAAEFRRFVEHAWGWLDGESLCLDPGYYELVTSN